jgi:hypothetical protein
MKKRILFAFSILIMLGSCSTTPDNPEPPVTQIKFELNYCPFVENVKEWIEYYEAGSLSKEELFRLIEGGIAVKKMEALKIKALNQSSSDGGMSALARKTRIKLDKKIKCLK